MGEGIKTFEIENPNSKKFLNEPRKLDPDIIINQSQSIIKEGLLQVPKIGVINRHNALLPKNRGRLTPFWVLYKGEKETGVSIHFVDEKGAIMARPLRIAYPGAFYHITSRGNENKEMFGCLLLTS